MSTIASSESARPGMKQKNEEPANKDNTQADENAHLLSQEEADLAFERDEMVHHMSADSHVIRGSKVWKVKGMNLKLSALEGTVAVKNGVFTYEDLEEHVDEGPADPLSGGLSAVFGAVGTVAQRVGDYPLLLAKVLEAKEDGQAEHEIAEFAKDSGKGVTGIGGAVLKAPMDITHNMSRGFHNLPKMYGDETVRPIEKVTDVQSGLEAAGKSFGLGLWDGVSGLVTQPMKGAQEGGWMGGLVGFGKGVGGAVFKPAAGVLGIPGYAFKGIYEEVRTTHSAAPQKDVAEAQMVQGFKEWEGLAAEDCKSILLRIKREIEDMETMEG
ncbi:Vacuolar sorting-associated 13A [Hyphodiscus hymeniophilus]|uniref:Vacuolar sorting-associated 13A n=1 Tax=Hyphodiscus hymeniophilus TaxID=353542 RepID=A0A9P6VLW8_9HELO|nr:Vacuolar sorting-associated 13A [Hyphodiscus hymeniophilus]